MEAVVVFGLIALAIAGLAFFLLGGPLVDLMLGRDLAPIELHTMLSGFACHLKGVSSSAVLRCDLHEVLVQEPGAIGQSEQRVPLWALVDVRVEGLDGTAVLILVHEDGEVVIDAARHGVQTLRELAGRIKAAAEGAERIEAPEELLALTRGAREHIEDP